MTPKVVSFSFGNDSYVLKTNRDIKLAQSNFDNLFTQALQRRYDASGEGDINCGNEMEMLVSEISGLLNDNGELNEDKLSDFLLNLVPMGVVSDLKEAFLNFVNLFIPKATDNWTVQNGQSIDSISRMYLKNSQGDFTEADLKETSRKIKNLNKKHLDGSGNAFLVGRKIKLPSKIDISDEKQSENPVYDYVWGTQTKRINDITTKYNLINKKDLKSKTFADAQSLANDFIKRYGKLTSTSMEHLILAPHFEASEEARNNIAKVRENTWVGSAPSRSRETDKMVRKYKTGNCGECAELLTKMGFEKFGDKYEISQINFYAETQDGSIDHEKEHVALLLKSKNSNEEFVVDTWINPKEGGVFRKSDWEKMMKEVYQIKNENIEFNSSSSDFQEFINEKEFWDSVPNLKKEIPAKELNSLGSFRNYVESGLRNGKHFSQNTMNLFKRYYGSIYREIFEEQKDFYAHRNTIAKEVSPEAAVYLSTFQIQVLDGLLEGKKYSYEVRSLFRELCPSEARVYDKTLDIRQHYKTILRYFPNNEKILSHEYYFCEAMWTGLRDGKKYPQELMELYYKYGDYRFNNEEQAAYSHQRIDKTDKEYVSFKSKLDKNMNLQTVHDYLHGISDERAFLLTLEGNCKELISDIDKKTTGWGQGDKKKSLIMPFVNYVVNFAKAHNVDSQAIDKFQSVCEKELNAMFYTDEGKIIRAFKLILSKINKDYRTRGFIPS